MLKQLLRLHLPNLKWTALKVAIIYFVVGALWIVFSDYLLYQIVGSSRSLPLFETLKGWAYAVVTALLLYLLIYRYLTLIHESEKSLREQELSYKELADSITDVYFALDRKLRFIFWNKASADLTGMNARDVLGRRIGEVFPDIPESFYQQVLSTGQPGTRERQFRQSVTGEIHYFESRITPSAGGLVVLSRDITERKQAERKLQKSVADLKMQLEGTINVLASIAERRDPSVPIHQKQVAKLAAAIGSEMGLNDDQIELLRVAGLLHDIGKISVPAEILSRPGPLRESEYSIVKTYPQVSSEILKPIKFPWPVADIVLQHQEKIDGSGYPHGLKGDQILLEARIIRVADFIEAKSSHRPYRDSFGLTTALEELLSGKGKIYDPAVVDAALRLFNEKGFKLV